jgi:subtilisin family serine protease
MRMLTFLLLVAGVGFGQFLDGQYIVELKDAEATVGERSRRVDRADKMEQQHRRLRAAFEARGVRFKGQTFRVVNSMMVEADSAADAEALAREFGEVARVHRVRVLRRSLSEAAVSNGVKALWDRIGIHTAGAGIKIGIIDSGIETKHPGFANSQLPALDGYPKVSDESNRQYTNNKVIVARSYRQFFTNPRDPEGTVLDRIGHGTAVAMAAAGTEHDSPLGRIAGMAPNAYIGVYKAEGSPGIAEGFTDAALLAAMEDCLADGMDIVNMSLGSDVAGNPESDILVRAVEELERQGIQVVIAAGNSGPDRSTMASPGTAPSALTLGSNDNGRQFATRVTTGDGLILAAARSTRSPATGEVSGLLASILEFDSTNLGCDALPAGRLTGRITLILRGVCTFEDKILNAAQAGAVGVVLYTDAARPTDFFNPSVTTANLPAVLLKFSDGDRLQQRLAAGETVTLTISLPVQAVPKDAFQLSTFSSRGPLRGVAIKPDLLATGEGVYTAAQTNTVSGQLYSSNGYALINGTSFSTPVAAGALAILKNARRGLTNAQYRSLLVNSSRPLNDGGRASVAEVGAGIMNLNAAFDARLAFAPYSLSLDRNQNTITIQNLSEAGGVYRVSLEGVVGTAPSLSLEQFSIPGGATATLQVALNLDALAPGVHEGRILVTADNGETYRVPYFFAKPLEEAARILTFQTNTGRAGLVNRDLVFFRALDANGVSLTRRPTARVLSGTGAVQEVQPRDSEFAGGFGLEVVLGLGTNVFEIDAGNGVVRTVSITGR